MALYMERTEMTAADLVDMVESSNMQLGEKIVTLRNELVRLTSRQTVPQDDAAIKLVREALRKLVPAMN